MAQKPIMTTDVAMSASNYFDGQTAAYDSRANQSFYRSLCERLCGFARGISGEPESLLEIGCGTGISTEVIREAFPRTMIRAVDSSAGFVDVAAGRNLPAAVYYGCRMADYHGPSPFEMVIANMSYHWLERNDIDRLRQVTREGGIVAITAPSRNISNHNHQGNRLLYDACEALGRERKAAMAPRRWRGIAAEDIENDGLELLDSALLDVVEKVPAEDFLAVVESRGVLFSLFGAAYPIAGQWIGGRLQRGTELELNWKIGVLLARRV